MNYAIPDYENIMYIIAEKKPNTEQWHPILFWDGATSDPAKEGGGRPYYPRRHGRQYIDGEFISSEQFARRAKKKKLRKKLAK